MTLKSFLWTVPFLSFLSGYYLLSQLYHIESIKTPPVVGLTLAQAFEILSDNNLNPRLLAQKEDLDLPEGTVLSQNPAAHDSIKPNQTIYLVTSRKPAKNQTPHLLGKTVETITLELANLGIRNKAYYLASSTPIGVCIGQQPNPGELLDDNKMITYISAGNTKPVVLPNFKNKPVSDVLEFLKGHNIPVTVTHLVPPAYGHDCRGTCVVTDQRPLAGSIIILDAQKPIQVQLQAG